MMKKGTKLGHGYVFAGHELYTDNPKYMYQVRYNIPTSRSTQVFYCGANRFAQTYLYINEHLSADIELLAIEYMGPYLNIYKELNEEKES